MSSGNSLDRVLKLWISLWHLVLENKRHLETVCAVLQKLVFDQTDYPKYKNWKAICEVGKSDHLMMMVLATLDLDSDDDVVLNIIAAFPDCFCKEQQQGPIPWSTLKQDCVQRAINDNGPGWDPPEENDPNWRYMMECHGTLVAFGLPYQEFFLFEEGIDQGCAERGVLLLPEEIPADVTVGTTLEWQGRKWIVVENRQAGGDNDDICVVPAECIDLTV